VASIWKVVRPNNERAFAGSKSLDASSRTTTARSKKAQVLEVLSVRTTSSGLLVYSTAWMRSSVSRIGAMNIWCPTGVGGVGTRQGSGCQEGANSQRPKNGACNPDTCVARNDDVTKQHNEPRPAPFTHLLHLWRSIP
jgi:hypothetical protein